MQLTEYPKGFAPQKPQQSISADEFQRAIRSGATNTRKYNGNRAHVLITSEAKVRIYSHNGTREWTDCLPVLCADIRSLGLPTNSFFDGELYVPSAENVESVQLLVNAGTPEKGAANEPALQPQIAVFDVLFLNGVASHEHPFSERAKLVDTLLEGQPKFHPAERIEVNDFDTALAMIADAGIEGLVLADPNASHKVNFQGNTKRGNCWKIKIRHTEDFRATGFVMSKDSTLGVGSLKLERKTPQGWVSVGKVGSFEKTFDRQTAMHAAYPIMVEVSHFGTTDRGNLEFPKIIRRREDLETSPVANLV